MLLPLSHLGGMFCLALLGLKNTVLEGLLLLLLLDVSCLHMPNYRDLTMAEHGAAWHGVQTHPWVTLPGGASPR